jgi:hypothetical protein
VGKVIEIVYLENESPLDGTLPQFIIVEFPNYCGPRWIKEEPRWVPVPPFEIKCTSQCCTFRYIPLSLAYAKTGHTFQGHTVGPGHAIPCIIIQPGNISMERNCPGLLYMFISRGTTIGTKENRYTSAIFFFTSELTKDHIQNLTKTKDGKVAERIK